MGLKRLLDIAKENHALIQEELETPLEFRSDDVKYTDEKTGKLDRKGVLKFLEQQESYRQQANKKEEQISPWLLKSAFTAEEASILIAGLESFDSLSQVEGFIATETAQDNSIFTEKNIERYQTKLENAFTIKEALVKELALELSSESSLQPATDDKELITRVSIYSWCKSQGIGVQHWERALGYAEAEEVTNPHIYEEKSHTKELAEHKDLLINTPLRENDLSKMMIAEMQGGYEEKGKRLTHRELFTRIFKNKNNDVEYHKDSDSLILISGSKTDYDAFKKRYASYFNSGD